MMMQVVSDSSVDQRKRLDVVVEILHKTNYQEDDEKELTGEDVSPFQSCFFIGAEIERLSWTHLVKSLTKTIGRPSELITMGISPKQAEPFNNESQEVLPLRARDLCRCKSWEKGNINPFFPCTEELLSPWRTLSTY
jgi:hypothetical protein